MPAASRRLPPGPWSKSSARSVTLLGAGIPLLVLLVWALLPRVTVVPKVEPASWALATSVFRFPTRKR